MKSTITKSVLGALAGASLMLAAGFASATTVVECQGQITTLISNTQSAEFVGRNAVKDEAGLVAKLQGASDKLGQGKFSDATQKVGQYRDKVNTLCAQGKIAADSDPSCAELLQGANDVLACIADLGN